MNIPPNRLSPQAKQWLLIVFDGKQHDRALHDLGLRPSKKPGQYYGFYALSSKPLLLRTIAHIKGWGCHGIAKQINRRQPTRSKRRPIHDYPLAADLPPAFTAPKPSQRPSAEIILIEQIAEARRKADAKKLAHEIRRQGQIRAAREAQDRAHRAILRAKGEL